MESITVNGRTYTLDTNKRLVLLPDGTAVEVYTALPGSTPTTPSTTPSFPVLDRPILAYSTRSDEAITFPNLEAAVDAMAAQDVKGKRGVPYARREILARLAHQKKSSVFGLKWRYANSEPASQPSFKLSTTPKEDDKSEGEGLRPPVPDQDLSPAPKRSGGRGSRRGRREPKDTKEKESKEKKEKRDDRFRVEVRSKGPDGIDRRVMATRQAYGRLVKRDFPVEEGRDVCPLSEDEFVRQLGVRRDGEYQRVVIGNRQYQRISEEEADRVDKAERRATDEKERSREGRYKVLMSCSCGENKVCNGLRQAYNRVLHHRHPDTERFTKEERADTVSNLPVEELGRRLNIMENHAYIPVRMGTMTLRRVPDDL